MSERKSRPSVPSLIAALLAVLTASVAISSCGGDDGNAAVSEFASWMPPDSSVYIEGTIRPEGEMADNVDQISTKLTGRSLDESIDKLIRESNESGIDFKTDVEPWLGDSAGLAVAADLAGYTGPDAFAQVPGTSSLTATGDGLKSDSSEVSLVVPTSDQQATLDFISKVANRNDKAEEGEYQGTAYTVSGDREAVYGVREELLLVAGSVAGFEDMIDAHDGESLAQVEAFSDLADRAADGSLANLFVNGSSIADSASGGQGDTDSNDDSGSDGGSGADPVYSALGIDPDNAGALISLVPKENEISLVGASNATEEYANGDPGPLLETFPANTVFTTGSAGVGDNLTRLVETVNEQGIEGTLEPGELQKAIDDLSSSGVDLSALIGSLDTAGLFVSGNSVDTLGGALVVTSSDLKPLEDSLALISSLIGQSRDATVRPLTGGVTGFRVKTPELPGRPVYLAVKDDRLVIAIGDAAARQALGEGGPTLADSKAYQAAVDSLSGGEIDLYADPPAIGKLIRGAADDPDAKKAADAMDKFEYIAGGGGDGEGSFEFNLGLGE